MSYNNNNEQRQPATIIKSVTYGDRVFNLSDKGAVTIRKIDGRFITALQPSVAKLLADVGAEPLKVLLESDEAKVISQNKEDKKLLERIKRDEEKALRYAQQAEEMLKALQEMRAKVKAG